MEDVKVPLKSKPVKGTKKFSSDPSMICQTFCCVCDKVVPLSSMKSHAKTWHKMTITEYKDLFGHPKKQILHPVYHRCALCKATVLFAPDEMYTHLKKTHRVSYRNTVQSSWDNSREGVPQLNQRTRTLWLLSAVTTVTKLSHKIYS